MKRIVLGPFNRVEGDLEVTLDVVDGRVVAAYVNSPLFRGFEQILQGKDPHDALVLVPRICGICSVTQSAAAAAALRAAIGVAVPPNGELATNLMLGAENLADHFTHFYLFFMPDFARDAYAARPWHAAARARFKALDGSAAADALPARADFLQLMGVLAGKWPHTLSLQPGGTARAITATEKIRLHAQLRAFRRWLERHLFGDTLEAVGALDSVDALAAWAARRPAASSDLRLFLAIAEDLDLAHLGRATDAFLSYGAYSLAGESLFTRGVWQPAPAAAADVAGNHATHAAAEGRVGKVSGSAAPEAAASAVSNDAPGATGGGIATALDPGTIREDISHAWVAGHEARHPWRGATEPLLDKDGAYSWCKAPRLGAQVVECGALARQVVSGHPLARDLVARHGGSVLARVVCRLLELALVVPAMEDWVRALRPGEPFCAHALLPEEAQGCGLVEAARGALGHWLVIRHGRIANYQIIAPTTWNFSPRDAAGVPGALEQALVGLPVDDGAHVPLAVQHVVRSFDPCMVCTVH